MHLETSLLLAPCPLLTRKSFSQGPLGCSGALSVALCLSKLCLSMTHRTGTRTEGQGAQSFISEMRKPRSERIDFSRMSLRNILWDKGISSKPLKLQHMENSCPPPGKQKTSSANNYNYFINRFIPIQPNRWSPCTW